MHSQRTMAGIFILVLALAGCLAPKQTGTHDSQPPEQTKPGTANEALVWYPSRVAATVPVPIPKQPISDFVARRRAEYMIPGVVVAINNGAEVWTFADGVADLETGRLLTVKDKFRIGSITKTFTAMAALHLVDLGRLSLNDSVAQWLPDQASNLADISVEQLIRHTSGLGDFTNNDVRWLFPSLFLPSEAMTHAQLIDIGLATKRQGSPGQGWWYSSTNYALLAQIVEAAGGSSLHHQLQTYFLNNPHLKLEDTLAPGPTQNTIPGAHSLGYVDFANMYEFVGLFKEGLTPWVSQSPDYSWGAGDLMSTAEDLVRWGQALGEGRLLSEQLFSQQFTWTPITHLFGKPAPAGMGMGLGLVHYEKLDGKRLNIAGHRGQITGFNGTLQYVIDKNLTIVVLSNRILSDEANTETAFAFDIIEQFFRP